MGLYDTVPLRNNLPKSFEGDRYRLTPRMAEKYRKSKITIRNGQIRSRAAMFCKNVSIFDVTGTKIVWGDIAPIDVKGMKGVSYILSEHKSFRKPDKKAVWVWGPASKDPYSRSPFRHLLPEKEPVVFDPLYVKRNAIARIVDGKIQTSKYLILAHY